MNETGRARGYHHGDLRNSLRDAARAILEEEGLAALCLRAVARKAGVSHAAPYRHFSNHEALLVELAMEGFVELRRELARRPWGPASCLTGSPISAAADMRFVARRPALARLMFGPHCRTAIHFRIWHRGRLRGDGDRRGVERYGTGPCGSAAVHGLAMLVFENVIDLGQRRSGLGVLPSRAEILLRSLFLAPQKSRSYLNGYPAA